MPCLKFPPQKAWLGWTILVFDIWFFGFERIPNLASYAKEPMYMITYNYNVIHIFQSLCCSICCFIPCFLFWRSVDMRQLKSVDAQTKASVRGSHRVKSIATAKLKTFSTTDLGSKKDFEEKTPENHFGPTWNWLTKLKTILRAEFLIPKQNDTGHDVETRQRVRRPN